MSDPEGEIDAHFSPDIPKAVGVAVSGGSDSMALLVLLRDYAARNRIALSCATVDHGLRPEAAAEAEGVAAYCAAHDVPHVTLKWTGWNGKGNTQNAARVARYRLLADWARGQGITDIALGHTQDDQAETVLMGLARASGVDGLSAMAARRDDRGLCWHRPLLAMSRAQLRGFLRGRGVAWCEDPSNEDDQFERIKARRALATLADLGVDRASLAQVAGNMAQARSALEHQTMQAVRDLVCLRGGGAAMPWSGFLGLPQEIARRLLVAAIDWIAAPSYAPRQKALAAALAAVETSDSATVAGCRLIRVGDTFWIFREFQAVAHIRSDASALWDDRWQIIGDQNTEVSEISALGEDGLLQCPEWRGTDLPRALLLATPAVWQGDVLIAAPVAQSTSAWRAEVIKRPGCLFDRVFGH
ncbi:tRNA lysidine(34) synthetase TilS [Roseobacter litoralis]|uniref:tRNA lysidine(34) synthetase TilS n=1 Tax=Roseobacter litoralis TaxID=42443 RepID=UPI002490DBAE|nr:tRNA lysidine(34) synthetase TilS [Roseobacter litoralis]